MYRFSVTSLIYSGIFTYNVTISVFSNGTAQFTTVPLKPWTDQRGQKSHISNCVRNKGGTLSTLAYRLNSTQMTSHSKYSMSKMFKKFEKKSFIFCDFWKVHINISLK